MTTDEGDLWRASRREFLIFSAGLISAMSLGGCAGIGRADVKFPEGRRGGNAARRVLVTYASRYGSTGEVADAIGREVCSKDIATDVVLIRNASDVGAYQGVVIGSAIYMGKWMPEAVDFLKTNRDLLRRVPVAYFLVCMTLARPTEENRAEARSYMDPILEGMPEVKPVALGTFAGALDYRNLSWATKTIMKSKGTPEGDFRDWNAIRDWTRSAVAG